MCKINRKAAFHSLGCKVNSYETEAMKQNLVENGYELVPFEPGADVYVINTCTVTNIADRKSRQMLHKAKKMNPEAVVIAVGCYVQAAGEELLKDDAIDIVVGTNRKSELYNIIEEYFRELEEHTGGEPVPENKKCYLTDVSGKCDYDNMEMTTVEEHTRAFIKIQDGCNQFCTYCIIPYARGRIRSRALADLRGEVEKLAQNGYQEIVLTGIHLSSYGKDLEEDITLLDAINCVSAVDGIARVRLGSLEQGIITEDFVKALAENPKFCPHFHLSLQSGSAGVLKRMNRHYTPEQYLEKCRLIRRYFDKPAFTTDVIVGFPGETEQEFAETEAFLREVAFAEMHIFKYSMRKGTIAAKMENQVADSVKTVRSDRLLALDEELGTTYRKQFLDCERDVLMEEELLWEGERYFIGYTAEYVKVAVPASQDYTNRIVRVKCKNILNKEILLAELVKIY